MRERALWGGTAADKPLEICVTSKDSDHRCLRSGTAVVCATPTTSAAFSATTSLAPGNLHQAWPPLRLCRPSGPAGDLVYELQLRCGSCNVTPSPGAQSKSRIGKQITSMGRIELDMFFPAWRRGGRGNHSTILNRIQTYAE